MNKYIVAFLLLFTFQSNAQGGPPPIGCDVYFVIDSNNDGYTEFDMNFYLTELRIKAFAEQNFDLSGYLLQLYPSESDLNNGTNEISTTYTNTVINSQYCYIKLTYSGAGIEYSQQDLNLSFSCVVIEAVPYNSDEDNDGVFNYLEDLNGNGILNDEDTNNDGVLNLLDTDDDGDSILTINEDYNHNGNYFDDDTNNNQIPDFLDANAALSIAKNTLSVFTILPNPASTFISINFENDFDSNFEIAIYDATGKLVFEKQKASKIVNISNLNAGLYLVKINSENTTATQKLIVK